MRSRTRTPAIVCRDVAPARRLRLGERDHHPEATMSDQKQNDPNPREWNNRMTSEAAPRANSPAATGGDPQAAQQPGGGGAPGTGETDVDMSEEAKNQW